MQVIGIDPGKTGAVAVIYPGGSIIDIYDTPLIGQEYDAKGMADILFGILINDSSHVFIEKVHSMPKQGVSSTFNFGMGYGIWQGILASLPVRVTFVSPVKWKKVLLEGKKDKDDARIRAIELFPQCHDKLTRKKDIGRADALLIAEYGRRIHGCHNEGDRCQL